MKFQDRNRWKLKDGRVIYLITPRELRSEIVNGQKLICIDGTTVVKGTDYIDDDTRAGYLAYGVEETKNEN